jgi:hypothetical protein
MRTNYSRLRARLARAEKLAGKGACPFCRLVRRHSWLDDTKPRPAGPSLIVVTRCEVCGADERHDLSVYPEELRAVARLGYTSTPEDTYTDPHAWAARCWGIHWDAAWREQRHGESRETWRLPATEQPREGAWRRKGREREWAKDPDIKLYNGLLAEALAPLSRRRKGLEHKYGNNPFPELAALVTELMGPWSPAEQLERARRQLAEPETEIREGPWWVCLEMEKVVLGAASEYTSGKAEERERKARERAAWLKAEHEQLLESLRRRDDEIERLSLERQAAAPEIVAPPAPAPPPATPPQQRPYVDRGTLGYHQAQASAGQRKRGPWYRSPRR